jgi:hypothetical protein
MRRAIVPHRRAKPAKRNPGRYVRAAEAARERRGDAKADAPSVTLGDERIAVNPEPIGEQRQYRDDRHEDPSAGHIRSTVGGEWTSIDQHGDRSDWWE